MSVGGVEIPPVPVDTPAVRSSVVARFIASSMMGLFLISTLMFPVAFVNKATFMGLFCLMLIAPLASNGRVRFRSLSPIVVLTIFLYGYALSFVGQTDPELTNQLMLSVAILLLIYLIDWYAIDIEYLAKIAGVVLCLFTGIAIYVVLVVPDSVLGGLYIDYFDEYTNRQAGTRAFSDSALFMFRIGPVPFLFLPFCLFLDSFLERRRVRDFLATLLISTVIVISASRALVLGCLLAAAFLAIQRMRPIRQVITLCVGAALTLFLISFLMEMTTVFSSKETSNSIKMGHAISFVEHMTPMRLLFGEGLAATYFSLGNNAVVPQTEITLLDIVRYVGLPLTALLYAALLFPVLRAKSYGGANRKVLILFVLYLVMALTNPVLFVSYGLIVVLWYWSKIIGERA